MILNFGELPNLQINFYNQVTEAPEHVFLHPDQVRESVILLSLDKHGGVNAFLLKTHNLEFLAL